MNQSGCRPKPKPVFGTIETTGINGGKKVNGRKRHIVGDKLGLLIAIIVTQANTHDAEASIEMRWQIDQASKRVTLIRADGSYAEGYLPKS